MAAASTSRAMAVAPWFRSICEEEKAEGTAGLAGLIVVLLVCGFAPFVFGRRRAPITSQPHTD